jgi:hypothetical protein
MRNPDNCPVAKAVPAGGPRKKEEGSIISPRIVGPRSPYAVADPGGGAMSCPARVTAADRSLARSLTIWNASSPKRLRITLAQTIIRHCQDLPSVDAACVEHGE